MIYELAQLNIARKKYDDDDPRFAGFMDHLDRINALGDAAPGAIWRFTDGSGAAIETQVFDDPNLLVNLTVWSDVESLWNFAYRSEHGEFLRRRNEWFDIEIAATTVLWWVPKGHRPTPDEAIERLEHLRAHGPSPSAFSFRDAHEPPHD